jgi:serine protease inhibitor
MQGCFSHLSRFDRRRCPGQISVATRWSWPLSLMLFSHLFCPSAFAQQPPQVQPGSFLSATDRVALELLRAAHERTQDRNVVLAPLPVCLTFAALWDGTADDESSKEIASTFHWEDVWGVRIASRMLLARFEKPKPQPTSNTPLPKKGDPYWLLFPRSRKPEEAWISAAFLYRGQGSLSQEFIDRVKHDFGFEFRAVSEHATQTEVVARNWDSALPMPAITGLNDFWITSFTHLRTSWAGNTFVESKREKHEFTLQSGDVVQADFLKSDLEIYPHVSTDQFEAVLLPGSEASILLVLPGAGKDIGQLAAALGGDPNLVEPLLAEREGDVQLPPFHFSYETDLKDSLEKMGIHRIFNDPRTLLSMAAQREGGVLGGVAQKAEITVDEDGIRADAGTIMRGAYGGILMPQGPFHMALNRPFLFVVRDSATRALLFIGIVMNPNLH